MNNSPLDLGDFKRVIEDLQSLPEGKRKYVLNSQENFGKYLRHAFPAIWRKITTGASEIDKEPQDPEKTPPRHGMTQEQVDRLMQRM